MTDTNKATRRAYVLYPRGFANEYSVYVVSRENEERFIKCFPDAKRITRKEALRLGHYRPKQAEKSGEHWGGRFIRTALAQSALDAYDECEIRTLDELDFHENV